MGNNRLGLIFEIAAQGADKAGADIASVDAQVEKLREQYAAIAADAERLRGLPFIGGAEAEGLRTDQELLSQIRAEAQGLGADFSQTEGAAVRSNLGDLLMLRRALYATFGLVSFGYIIGEWKSVASAIKNAASEIGGFSSAAQKAFQEDIKASDYALTRFQGLTLQAQITNGQFLIAQTNQYIAALGVQQKATEESMNAARALAGPLGAALDAKDAWKRLLESREEARLHEVLISQLQDMTKLQKQLHEEQAKGAKADASASAKQAGELKHTQETAARWYAMSLRAIAQEKREQDAWNKSMEKSIEHAIKLGDTVTTNAAKTREEHHQEALATMPQGPKNEVPGSAGGAIFAQAAQASIQPLTRQRQALLALNDAFAGTHTSMQKFTGEAAVVSAASDKFAQGMGRATMQAIVYGQSVGKAVEIALKATLASIAEEAAVRALFSLATYWIDLATYQYTSAAQALTAAEIFGAVAGGAGAAALAIPGGGGGGRGGGGGGARSGSGAGRSRGGGGSDSGSGSGQQLAPGGNLPAAPKNGNLTIAIMGESEAGAWLANTINKAVQQGGAQLTATHMTAIPNPVA